MSPFRKTRGGRLGQNVLPPSLVNAVETFKTTMLEMDRGLASSKLAGEAAQLEVGGACGRLEEALQEHVTDHPHLARAVGTYVHRETFAFFMLSRFIDRAFTKPRGYAGDYATIEMLYADEAVEDSRLGPRTDRWILRTSGTSGCEEPPPAACRSDSRAGRGVD